MIEIRFKQRYSQEITTSPIKLSFTIDVVEPALTPIGIDFVASWVTNEVIQTEVNNVWSSINITNTVVMPWLHGDTNKQEFTALWSISLPVVNDVLLSFKTNTKIEHNEASSDWLTKLLRESQTTSTYWLTFLDSELQETSLHWNYRPIIEAKHTFKWSSNPNLNSQQLVIHYGETDKQYICYWRNHPFKGYVNLEFSEPAQLHNGRLVMRFNNPDKICYWGLPGGLVRGDDDVPTIDRKIPIEPQIRNTYIMQPTIDCVRVSDDLKILISSVSYSISRGQFSATCNIKFCSRIDFDRALGQELKISINGYDFYVICEQPSTSNSFANASYSASCRSRFALLSAPYARATNYTNPTAKTLAGIMSDILINTGWSLDNQMIDYAIPTGAFSYTNLTPAAALLSVAKSVGAMLDIDNANKTVSIVPLWPVMPWDTESAICDVILNDSIILEHNTSQTINQEHNAVFVRGEQQGVACKIKRAGTLGDKFASDVVDSLITDNQAARQRGTCELANSGNKQQATMRTKIKADLPPIRPGMLVGVTYSNSTYKATCDSLTINASINAQGAITVSQTIKVISNV
ncbi:hypothetical protein CWB76_11555 [Pseudoalteromonas sp. S1609]|uniref:hypothetical protein n=1 Tax=Pseudoalteromonas sp. S1609 TaxID=579505 RepID=UPI00110B1C20|nr:hypothetical protein [Pseudoalteromonas sp. S1609]TMP70258.1 hypothetical protein CWB76_11555 [Pseudoalteromonas sp. S1609]